MVPDALANLDVEGVGRLAPSSVDQQIALGRAKRRGRERTSKGIEDVDLSLRRDHHQIDDTR